MADSRKRKMPGKDQSPSAGSVDREPSAEPTPAAQGVPVSREDEPRGQPTSDRFRTEQAHQTKAKQR